MWYDKRKKISDLTVEQFEFILNKIADKLIENLKTYHTLEDYTKDYTVHKGKSTEVPPLTPGLFEVWCEGDK